MEALVELKRNQEITQVTLSEIEDLKKNANGKYLIEEKEKGKFVLKERLLG